MSDSPVKHKINIEPDGLTLHVDSGTLIKDAVKLSGVPVNLPCGGAGKCGKCAVEIRPDSPEPGTHDIEHLSPEQIKRGMRLACRTKVLRDMTVYLPREMRASGSRILAAGVGTEVSLDPAVRKIYLEIEPPVLGDHMAERELIIGRLAESGITVSRFGVGAIRKVPRILSSSNYRFTAVIRGDELIDLEAGDTTGKLFGMAFDIGTTTVVGKLVDLNTAQDISFASRLNSQITFGEDTISRIKHAVEKNSGIEELREKIIGVVNEIIFEAAEKAGVDACNIYEAVFAGNTTMSHLLLGVDPRGLSGIPFIPAFGDGMSCGALESGILINPLGCVYVMPNVAGFVGSDTVAVMLAAGYFKTGPVQLAVDVGTNGELALRNDSGIRVCSTAAGPALEGASLSSGMRAATGALEHVKIGPEGVKLTVIGNTDPIGICGSGIIDILAELLNTGVIDESGAFRDKEEIARGDFKFLAERIIEKDGQPAFVLFRRENAKNGERDVLITQRDVRQIQLAKGAIAAGISLLIKSMGLNLADVDEILLAGAFGNYIDKEKAQRIGLLPAVPPEKIKFIGNAASTGAKMALISQEARAEAEKLGRTAGHLELANLPDFINELTEQMIFPEKTV